MARRHWHPGQCKVCGASRFDGVKISQTGLCWACGRERFEQNLDQLHYKAGPYYLRWARRSLMAMHRELVAAERGEA